MRKKKKQKGKVWTKCSSLSPFLRIQGKQFWNLNLQQRAPAKNVTVFDMELGEIASCPGTYWFEVFAFATVFSFLFYIHILFYCEVGDFLKKIFLNWISRKETASRSLQSIIRNIIQTVTTAGEEGRGNGGDISIVFFEMGWFKPQVGVAGLGMPVQHWVQRHVHSTPMPR